MALSGFVIRILFLALPGIIGSKIYKKLRGRPGRETWENFVEILLFSVVAYGTLHLVGCDQARRTTANLVVARLVPPFTVRADQAVTLGDLPGTSVAATRPVRVPATGAPIHPVRVSAAGPVTFSSTQPVVLEVGGSPIAVMADPELTVDGTVEQAAQRSVFAAFTDDQIPLADHVRTIATASLLAVAFSLAAAAAHNYRLLNRLGRLLCVSNRSGDEDPWTCFNTDDDVQWVFVRDYANNRVYAGAVRQYSDSDKGKQLVLEDVDVYDQAADSLLYHADVVFLSRDKDWTVEVPQPPDDNGSVGRATLDGPAVAVASTEAT